MNTPEFFATPGYGDTLRENLALLPGGEGRQPC